MKTSHSSGLTDGSPVLSGSAEAGSEVVVTVTDGQETAEFTTSADASGNWSVNVVNQGSFTVTDGDTLNATVVSTDSVGNSTTETASATVDSSIDPLIVGFEDVTSSGLTDGSPVLSGSAEAGSEVVVTVTDGQETAEFTTSADASGNWSVQVVDQGNFTVTDGDTLNATVVSTDSVGNSTTETASATVDSSIDPLIVGFEDVTSSGLTDGSPVLSGSAEAGSEVVVTVTDGQETAEFTTSADASGNWSVQVVDQGNFTVTDGDTLNATVVSTDSVGNSTSETVSAVVDNTTDLTNVAFENTLTNTAGDFVGGKPVLSGVAEVGATVTVVVTDGTE